MVLPLATVFVQICPAGLRHSALGAGAGRHVLFGDAENAKKVGHGGGGSYSGSRDYGRHYLAGRMKR